MGQYTPQAAAVHELGHAYALLDAGVPMRLCMITTDPVNGATRMSQPDEITEDQALGVLVMYMAGPAATERLMVEAGVELAYRSSTDYASFASTRAVFEAHSPGVWPDQAETESLARQLIESYWGRILATVPLLVERGSLSTGELL